MMMYVEFNAGNEEYKLKLSVGSMIALEKKIGTNPIAVFGLDDENPVIPTITTMVAILWASLQDMQHGITMNDAQGIFEAWLNDGNIPTDFIRVITDVYKVSGIFKQREKGDEEKN
jgi:hypothetical protein